MSEKVLVIAPPHSPLQRMAAELEKRGFAVVSASRSPLGMVLLDESEPDIAILDAGMPNSLRTCAVIKDLANIPVILVGSEDFESVGQAFSEAAEAYLTSLAAPRELAATINSVLRRYRRT